MLTQLRDTATKLNRHGLLLIGGVVCAVALMLWFRTRSDGLVQETLRLRPDEQAIVCWMPTHQEALIVARNYGSGSRLEIYERNPGNWTRVWRGDSMPRVVKLIPGKWSFGDDPILAAAAAGNRLYLVRDAAGAIIRQELTSPAGSVRDIALVAPGEGESSAIMGLVDGDRKAGRLLGCRAVLWRCGGASRGIIASNIRRRHNAWAISGGDVDGDGNTEVLVSMWKPTRSDPFFRNRPFIFCHAHDILWPKWLGSRLARPFVEARLGDVDGDGRAELVATEKLGGGKYRLALYRWNGFGFTVSITANLMGTPSNLMLVPDTDITLVSLETSARTQRVQLYEFSEAQARLVWRSPEARTARPIGFMPAPVGQVVTCLDGVVCVANVKRVGAEAGQFTFIAVGDVMLARGVGMQVDRRGPSYPFENVAERVKSADIAICNLESPACETPLQKHGRDAFRAPTRALEGLRVAGFDVVTMANNHSHDCGVEGLEETERRIRNLGLRTSEDAPLSVKGNSLKVRVLAFDLVDDSQGPKQAGARICSSIVNARKTADFVVVSVHWGREYAASPDHWQRTLARKMVDSGADAIVGHHPHVLQGVEFYRGRPIAYSLGNFVFDQLVRKDKEGGLLTIVVVNKRISQTFVSPVLILNGRASITTPRGH